jgi:hypothetical protein
MSIKKGYFLLADITGFTSFIAGSELEHSKLILNEILNCIVKNVTPDFKLVEIEGDAVFVFAPLEKFSRGELILEMIEAAYIDFRDMRATNERLITCQCNACQMSKLLDLKFVVHSGEYVLSEVADKAKPLGTSVNAVHRLLKNRISEQTGWKAYALFTEECLNTMSLELEDVHVQTENYEHIGEIKTFSINLDNKYRELKEGRNEYLSVEDADFVYGRNFAATPQSLWEWANNPAKRSQWLEVTDWRKKERPLGRTGKGATNHCANSNFLEKLLDYKPFAYYTSEIKGGKFGFTLTGRLIPKDNSTDYYWNIRLNSSLPKWIRKKMCSLFLTRGLKLQKGMQRLSELIDNEAKTSN